MTAKKHHLKLGGAATITVVVGQGDAQETFFVHEPLITSRSPFFRNALQGRWQEAQERTVNLTEDDPEVFTLYTNGLYTGHVDIEESVAIEKQYNLRGLLYVLAERIGDIKTKNLVIEEIKTKTDVRSHLAAYMKMAADIYDGTPGPCGVRELLVDLLAKSNPTQAAEDGAESFKAKLDGLSPAFMMDLVFGMYTKRWTDRKFSLREDYGEKTEEMTANKGVDIKVEAAAKPTQSPSTPSAPSVGSNVFGNLRPGGFYGSRR